MTTSELLYFAYGSNMVSSRLQSRVPSARALTTARLPDFQLAFRKLASDGSTKCDLEPTPGAITWGVVYRLDADERDGLDAAEGAGYRRETVQVTSGDGYEQFEAYTYRANADWVGDGRPWVWYRDLVAAGAGEHELPAPYVAGIEAIDADPDPDADRAAANSP